ncbi:MAG: hypothetical protein KZQ58_01890 [gamma proteobacterium symbiont of Bathyaustriella thionipta]|nr:hypothetical protein [gamma proteobacterium symbiont of Bathyaustriella thionipta]
MDANTVRNVDPASFDRLSQAFETSARRWELIVYPSLFAFIILAAYGFYLVFSLAKDIHVLVNTVDRNMTEMSDNIRLVSEDVSLMSHNMRTLTVGVESISQEMNNLGPMLSNISDMNSSMQSMSRSTHDMRYDLAHLNRNIGRPMSFMNHFMPW